MSSRDKFYDDFEFLVILGDAKYASKIEDQFRRTIDSVEDRILQKIGSEDYLRLARKVVRSEFSVCTKDTSPGQVLQFTQKHPFFKRMIVGHFFSVLRQLRNSDPDRRRPTYDRVAHEIASRTGIGEKYILTTFKERKCRGYFAKFFEDTELKLKTVPCREER